MCVGGGGGLVSCQGGMSVGGLVSSKVSGKGRCEPGNEGAGRKGRSDQVRV